jgi:hypothetical protein
LVRADNKVSEDGLRQEKFSVEEVLAGALNMLLADCLRHRPESRRRTPSARFFPPRVKKVRPKKRKPRITRKAKVRSRNERRLARINGEASSPVLQDDEDVEMRDSQQSKVLVPAVPQYRLVAAQPMIVARRDRFKQAVYGELHNAAADFASSESRFE